MRVSVRRLCCGWMLWAALALGAACGESQSDDSPPAPVDMVHFAGAYAEAACRGLGACCPTFGATFDESTCRARLASQAQQFLDSLQGLDVTYHPDKAGLCFAAVEAYNAGCGSIQSDANLAACRAMTSGSHAPGQSCQAAAECAGAPHTTAYCPMGTCELNPPDYSAQRHGKLGETCNAKCYPEKNGVLTCSGSGAFDSGVTCFLTDGLTCETLSKTCQTAGGVGAPCAQNDCATSAWCQWDDPPTAGVCVARVKVGEPCSDQPPCVQGAWCSTDTGLCAKLTADGGACASDSECGYRCIDGACTRRTIDAQQCAEPNSFLL